METGASSCSGVDDTSNLQNSKEANLHAVKPHNDPIRCLFFLDDKKRYCRMQKLGDYNYCAEHMEKVELVLTDGKKRIPCPYDSNHTCFEHLLRKHLKKCNFRPTTIPSYIIEDANVWDVHLNKGSDYLTAEDSTYYDKRDLDGCSDSEYSDIIRGIIELHTAQVPETPDCYGVHPVVGRELVRSDIGEDAAKHMAQAGSILNILENKGLLQDNTCFIEYGSGRGALTFFVANAVLEKKLKDCSFVLVDKTSPRHKRDNKLKECGLSITRIRADIKDLCVGQLPDVQSTKTKHVVGIAKHLCGGATDMTLHSLFEETSNAFVDKVAGAVLATCCHHRCDIPTYVGMKWLSQTFFAGHLQMLTQMAAWGTNGDVESLFIKNRNIKEVHLRFFELLTRSMYPRLYLRHTIGLFIKNLIDSGRVAYILGSNNGQFFAELVNFVDKETTLENKAIVVCRANTAHEHIKTKMQDELCQRRAQFSEIEKGLGVIILDA